MFPSRVLEKRTILPLAIYDRPEDGQAQVPKQAEAVKVILHRVNLPQVEDVVCTARLDMSLDGGVTWSPDADGQEVWEWAHFPVIFTAYGKESLDLDGNPFPFSTISTFLPQALLAANDMYLRLTLIPGQSVEVMVEYEFLAE